MKLSAQQINNGSVSLNDKTIEAARTMRVCIVAPSLDLYGGQSIQAARLIEGLNKEPGVAADLLPHNPRLPGFLRSLQKIKYLRTLVTELAYIFLLLLRLSKYDVVHVFSASYFSFLLAPAPAILIAKLFGKPVILNYHSGEAEDHLRRWKRSAMPIVRMADRVITPSNYLVDVFTAFGFKAEAIFNTVELDRFVFRERPVLRPVLFSNRNLEAHYNVADTLRAFALIEARLPEARLIIAGDGREREELKKMAVELGLKRVEFVGAVSPERMPAFYDSADFFINASLIDNMPLSIIEAFASGLAVVTTGAGGIPRIVNNGRNGVVVEPGDYRGLAAGVMALIENQELAHNMIDHAQCDCILYTWATVKSEWMKVYTDLTRSRIIARSFASRFFPLD